MSTIISNIWSSVAKSKRYPITTISTLPIIAFRKDTSLKQTIGTNTIHTNEKLIKTKNNYRTGKCVLRNSKRCFCCQQLN